MSQREPERAGQRARESQSEPDSEPEIARNIQIEPESELVTKERLATNL